MAVKLRLVRMGKKKQPTYRVVAAESRRARSGAFLEIVGTYQPRGLSNAQPETVVQIDNDRAVAWLRQGAQPTERVEKLLRASGAWDAFTAAKAGVNATTTAESPVVATPNVVHAVIDEVDAVDAADAADQGDNATSDTAVTPSDEGAES